MAAFGVSLIAANEPVAELVEFCVSDTPAEGEILKR
jgi:hypothetical protein